MFNMLIVALANLGYVIIKGSVVELSVDGRLLDMEEFYNTLFSEIESLDFSVTPINADLEGDAFRVESLTNGENNFILNVIYCLSLGTLNPNEKTLQMEGFLNV